MKKLFALLVCVLLVFTLASCGDEPCAHRDADDNSLCDKCGESYTDGKDVEDSTPCQHKDADDNSFCDKCGESYSDGKDGNNNTTTDVNSITLNKNVVNIEVGDSESLTVSFNPENATDKNITWISSDSSIALVNNGIVVGVKVGTTTIIAMTANGKTATCLVNVSPKTYYAKSVTLNKTSVDLPIGHTDTLTATVLPDYTTDKSVTWVSSAPSIVKVENGVITALSAGTATITATTSNGKTASCTVTALFIPVTDIIINESLIYVDAGDSITVNATAVPENATLTNLVWSSSNTNIATVSGGVINGVSDGIAVITVKIADGKIEKSFNVVVENSAGILYTKSGSGYAVSGLAQATETVIIPDTYKGKPVISLSSGIFDSSAYVIKKLYIGKNVTNIPLGCLRNCTALEELSIHNINCANFGDLFGSLSIQWAGTVDDFIFLDFESKWNSTFGFEYQVPTSSSRWGINRSSAWYNVNGVYVYAPSSIISHGDVVSWQTVYINPSNVNVDSYKVPKAVNLKAYYIPKTLTKIYLTGTNSSEGYPPEIDWIDSFATVLSTCKDKAQNAKVTIAGTEVTLPISSIISLPDVEKLKALGTYEITVYYGGYITTVKVTVTECTGTTAVQENYKDSTCTKTGSYDSVTYCYSCNKELSRIAKTIDAKGHSPKTAVEENRVEATCTEDGHYDSVVYCSRCDGEVSRETETITKLGHNYSADWTIDLEPTCTEKGSKSNHCTRCGDKANITEIAANGHSFEEWYEIEAPDCINTGTEEHECSVCHFKETQVISELGHSPKASVEENRVEATCTEDGHYDSVVYCSRCDGEVSRETETITKLGHNYSADWTIDLEPTCTEKGSKSNHCSRCGDKANITEIAANGHSFEEWYEIEAPDCINTGTEEHECSVCHFKETKTVNALGHNLNKDWNCQKCNEKVVYYRDGNYIYFGEYPQTLKAESVTVTDIQDSRGYYIGSDGFYYAMVVAVPNSSNYNFSTGTTIIDGEIYYFKVEPIRWRILSEDSETAFILCDSIIANHRYDDSSNNYKESEIRQWLNATFYETAFSELQRDIILTTMVDNSINSTGTDPNQNTCEDTMDKIFLLSHEEAKNNAYGFSSWSERTMKTSDYSRANGVFLLTDTSNYGIGGWWLRSPGGYEESYTQIVSEGGTAGLTVPTNIAICGTVPALRIRL